MSRSFFSAFLLDQDILDGLFLFLLLLLFLISLSVLSCSRTVPVKKTPTVLGLFLTRSLICLVGQMKRLSRQDKTELH